MFRLNKKLFEPILASCCGKKFPFYFDQFEKYLHVFVKNFNGGDRKERANKFCFNLIFNLVFFEHFNSVLFLLVFLQEHQN